MPSPNQYLLGGSDPSPVLTTAPSNSGGAMWWLDPQQRNTVSSVISALASPLTETWQHGANIAQGRGDYGTELANLLIGLAGVTIPEGRAVGAAEDAAGSIMRSIGSRPPTAANANVSQANLIASLPGPLSQTERFLNAVRGMPPDEMLRSEPLWGAAQQGADAGQGFADAFARLANMAHAENGHNMYMTPEMAKKFIAGERAKYGMPGGISPVQQR